MSRRSGPLSAVKGAKPQDIGPSRAGQTSKLYFLTDVIGRSFALRLTPGNVADLTATALLRSQIAMAGHLLGDNGYDSDPFRRSVCQAGARPVIGGRSNSKRRTSCGQTHNRDRHLIENAICRLKDISRIATPYDNLAQNVLSAAALATLVAFWI